MTTPISSEPVLVFLQPAKDSQKINMKVKGGGPNPEECVVIKTCINPGVSKFIHMVFLVVPYRVCSSDKLLLNEKHQGFTATSLGQNLDAVIQKNARKMITVEGYYHRDWNTICNVSDFITPNRYSFQQRMFQFSAINIDGELEFLFFTTNMTNTVCKYELTKPLNRALFDWKLISKSKTHLPDPKPLMPPLPVNQLLTLPLQIEPVAVSLPLPPSAAPVNLPKEDKQESQILVNKYNQVGLNIPLPPLPPQVQKQIDEPPSIAHVSDEVFSQPLFMETEEKTTEVKKKDPYENKTVQELTDLLHSRDELILGYDALLNEMIPMIGSQEHPRKKVPTLTQSKIVTSCHDYLLTKASPIISCPFYEFQYSEFLDKFAPK